MKKLKILMISFSDNADHQECLYSMFEEMHKAGEDVYAMGIKHPKYKTKLNKNTIFVGCPKRPGLVKETFYFWRIIKIIEFIRKNKFDIIYFESLHIWNLPLLFKWGNYKTYHVLHDVIPHEGDKSENMIKLMNKIIVRLTDFIINLNKI